MGKDSVYHWRVRTRSINKEDSYSEIFHFGASVFGMQSPVEGDTTELAPTFVCDSIAYPVVEYTFEVSSTSNFDKETIVYTGVSTSHRHTMLKDLLASRYYYARVTAKFSEGNVMANPVKFRTKPQDVPIPEIISPTNGTHFAGNNLMITWKEQPSSGFQLEYCTDSSFPNRFTKRKRIREIDVFSHELTGLEMGTWYIRIKASAEGGYTEPSEVITVYMGSTAAVDELQVQTAPTKIVENGQVYILRNGKRYTILGCTIGLP
jgi:hypothetical protein